MIKTIEYRSRPTPRPRPRMVIIGERFSNYAACERGDRKGLAQTVRTCPQ